MKGEPAIGLLCTFAALAGCASPGPCDFPADASVPATVLEETDTCGFWLLAAPSPPDGGGHLILGLHVQRELPNCALSLGPSLSNPNDPIYTNLAGEGPKYTYDIVADGAVEETTVDIACDEATEWHALVTVE